MFVIQVAALAAFAFLAYKAVSDVAPIAHASHGAQPVTRISAERLARGEIDRGEYERIVRTMIG